MYDLSKLDLALENLLKDKQTLKECKIEIKLFGKSKSSVIGL